jgi:hypothetical protein
MSINICHYELFTRDEIDYYKLVKLLGISTGLPLDKIGTQDAFFTSVLNGKPLEIGVNICYYHEEFKTFATITSAKELNEQKFYSLAANMAKLLKTDVAIYDTLHDSKDVIVFYSDYYYQKAHDNSDDRNNFVVQVYGNKLEVKELLKMIPI